MDLSLLKEAITEQKSIQFHYKGEPRLVDPHLIGENFKDHVILSAYQTSGYSSQGNLPAWRQFIINEISDVKVLDNKFMANPQYNPNDSRMKRIIHRIEL